MYDMARDTHQQLRLANRSVACMQPTATLPRMPGLGIARLWHCQVRLHVNGLY